MQPNRIARSEIVWDPSVYPRAKWSTATVDRYCEAHAAGETFPALVLEKGTNRLLDGKHRLLMYEKMGVDEVDACFAAIPEGVPVKLYAASLSARHGDRLSNSDTKSLVREVYANNPEFTQETVAKLLGITQQTVSGYVSDILAKRREERRAKVLRLTMLGWTQAEIADRLGTARTTITADVKNTDADISDILSSGHTPEEIALRLGWPVQLVRAKQLEQSDDVARLDALGIKIQPYDVWHFPGCHDLMGDKHPGRIPGELLAHVLYFYTQPGDLVIDPMAGSGTTLDACLLMGRKARGYDVDHRHERIDVEEHDMAGGWPETTKKASLVFWDPPYFDKMDDTNVQDGYCDKSISKLTREAYLAFFLDRLSELRTVTPKKCRLAFLMADWNDNDDKQDGIFIWDYASIIQRAGWTLTRHIQVPLSTQQVHPDIVNKYRASRKLARLERYLLMGVK